MKLELVSRFALVLALGAMMGQTVPTLTPATPAPSASTSEITATLQQLASDDFAAREAAQAALQKIPASEIQTLLQLADKQTDPEIKSRLTARIADMAVEWVRRPQPPTTPLAVRVQDVTGKPIPGAWVTTTAYRLGPLINEQTDAQGFVTLQSPVKGFPLWVRAYAEGYGLWEQSVQPGATDPSLFTLTAVTSQMETVRGTVVDDQGKPVPNQLLKLMGASQFDGAAVTGPQGEFSVTMSRGRDAIPMMSVGELVAPLELIRDPNLPISVRLVPAATLTGKITEKADRRPIANAQVAIHPKWNIPRIRFGTRTAADGTYKITGIAPGEYVVEVEDPAYFDPLPRGRAYERPSISLFSGKSTTADLAMQRSAIVIGQVVDPDGKPVEGVILSLPSSVNTDHEQSRGMQTSADGKFALGTGHVGKEDLSLSVSSLLMGKLDKRLPPLAAGEVLPMLIQLPGTVRVKGIIADAAGKPISNVVCSIYHDTVMTLSKADGSFDFGRVTLVPGNTPPSIAFHAPRPRRSTLPNRTVGSVTILDYMSVVGQSGRDFFVDVPSRDKAPQFFLFENVPMVATPKTGELSLKVTLKPAHLVELTGIVKDPTGKPASNAEVYLLSSDAKAYNWLKSARYLKQEKFSLNGSGPPPNLRLSETLTDAEGRWRIFAIWEENATVTFGGYAKGASTFIPTAIIRRGVETMEVPMQLSEQTPP